MFVTKEFLRRETPDCLPRRENIYCIVIAMIGDPCRLEHMYAIAVKENADVVYGNFTMAHSDRMEEYILPAHDWQMDKTKALQAYVTYGWTTIWDLLTRKELYRKYNIFSPGGVTYCEDFNLAVRLLFQANKVVHIDDAGYFYNRANQTSFMHNRDERSMRDEQTVYLDIIDFFKKHQVYDNYRKQMCWRILKSKQDWLLGSTQTWPKFIALVPESRDYIWSCPFLNWKLKVNGWCLTHHLKFVSLFMLFLRKLKH